MSLALTAPEKFIQDLPTFLPGRFAIEIGSPADFYVLEHFHYLPRRPSSWAGVLRVSYRDELLSSPRVVAVGVLSYPMVRCRLRDRALRLKQLVERERLAFVNQHIRCISRVIVHPQFRALGLASTLVRVLIESCPTRYVEALAVMGRAHPFFKAGGMSEYLPDDAKSPVYYLFDRGQK